MPQNKNNYHLVAILQALLVVFLWATSWVFIKIGLITIPPLTFAGLRYALAFLCLLGALSLNKPVRTEILGLPKKIWARLIILGLLFYAGTQGAIIPAGRNREFTMEF